MYRPTVITRMSKNKITIDQLRLACRHVGEMQKQGVTENLAIRTLELFANIYAKLSMGGRPSPDHVSHYTLWSREARRLKKKKSNGKPKDMFRVEHGTPRRAFARMVLDLYNKDRLNEKAMLKIVEDHWRVAVVTLKEDQRLNKIARSTVFPTPEERWAKSGIRF